MIILQVLAAALVGFAVVTCFYHLFLAAVGLMMRLRPQGIGRSSNHRFAIVVPACNEEGGIGATLDSLLSLDYPREKFHIYVIADNCSDGTARVAEHYGITCLVRNDPMRRGKGFALEWVLPRLFLDEWDALIVLDADCTIDAHALRSFDQHLTAGDRVLQAQVVANTDQNALTYVLGLANFLENEFFDAPRSALGLAGRLRGTGMVLKREVLQQISWQASSVVEDAEYSYRLLEAGIPVRFIGEARVLSNFPTHFSQLRLQRTRWIGGIRIGIANGMRFLLLALRNGKPLLLEKAFTLAITGRFLVAFEWLAAFALSFLCWSITPAPSTKWLFVCTLLVAGLYILYAGIGMLLLGLNAKRIFMIVDIPVIVLRYLIIAFWAIVCAKSARWTRTPRL